MIVSHNDRGFTLVEITISLVITLIVAVVLFKLYNSFSREASCSMLKVEAQQKARVAVEMMVRDIGLTGFAVPSTYPVTNDILPSVAVAKDNEVTVRFIDPDYINGEEKRLVVTYEVGTSSDNPLVKTTCEADTDWAVTTVCETANYVNSLDPDASGGGLFFKYFNRDGAEVTPEMEPTFEDKEIALNSIKYVGIQISVRTEIECLRASGVVGFDSISVNTRVALRNKIGRGRP